MGYNSSTGILTIDTSTERFDEILDNVANALGDYRVTDVGGVKGRDVGLLCTSPNINKWAKYKPIKYSKYTPLLDAEYKGSSLDNQNGLYYGIKLPVSVLTALDKTLESFHQATFDYVGPSGGSYPYRITDFNGYSKNATPNPYISFNRETTILAYFDDEGLDTGGLNGISFRYYDTAIYSVDFTFMLQDSSVSLQYVLECTYPCILITDSSGNSYFTALYQAGDAGERAPRPILKDGIYAGGSNWYVTFEKPYVSTEASGITNPPPWTSAQEGLTATLFLMRSASQSAPLLTVAGTNFAENWIHLGTTAHASANMPVVIPGGVGMPMKLISYATASEPDVVFAPTSVIGLLSSGYPQFWVAYAEETGGSTSDVIEVECTIALDDRVGNYVATRTFSNGYPSGTGGQIQAMQFIITADGLLQIQTTTYTGKVTIKTVIGTKVASRSMAFSVTIES